jgi:hypothetical protein
VWVLFSCPETCMRVHIFRFWFPLITTVEPIYCCSGLSLQLQVQWKESKVDLHFSCRSCPHCLKQASICSLPSSALLVFNVTRPLHSGSIGNYGSYRHGVYPVHSSPLVLVPNFSQRCLCRFKRRYRSYWLPHPASFSMSAPCLKLVQST